MISLIRELKQEEKVSLGLSTDGKFNVLKRWGILGGIGALL